MSYYSILRFSKFISNYQRGFSLIEILVSLALFSIMVLLLVGFFFWMDFYNARIKAGSQTLESARRALDSMSYEIREAKGIYTPTTTQSQLSLETSHYLPNDETNTFIDFFLCGSALCLKRESQNILVLTPDTVEVTNITFTQLLNGVTPAVQTSITVSNANPGSNPAQSSTVTLTSTASLRNQ